MSGSKGLRRLFLVLLGLALAATAATAQGHDITDKAEVTKVSMYLAKVVSGTTEKLVVFEVTLKNVTSAPLRYSVNVLVPGVGAGEDFAPAEQGTIAAGEEGPAKVGVMTGSLPSGFRLVVRPLN